MDAIGRIDHVDSKGNISVTMFYDNKWQGSWILTNKNEMPEKHPDFGVFRFQEADQFCEWIDPNQDDKMVQELVDFENAMRQGLR